MSTKSFEITQDDLEEIEKMLQDDIAAKSVPVPQPSSLQEYLEKRKENGSAPVRLRRG